MFEHVPFVQSSKITDIWSDCLFSRSSWVWYFRPCCIIRGRWRARVTGIKGQSENRLCRGIIAPANQFLEWRRALGVATRDFQAPLFTAGADGALWNKSTFSNLMLPRERRRICSCATAMYWADIMVTQRCCPRLGWKSFSEWNHILPVARCCVYSAFCKTRKCVFNTDCRRVKAGVHWQTRIAQTKKKKSLNRTSKQTFYCMSGGNGSWTLLFSLESKSRPPHIPLTTLDFFSSINYLNASPYVESNC